jgi:hypothetical protein
VVTSYGKNSGDFDYLTTLRYLALPFEGSQLVEIAEFPVVFGYHADELAVKDLGQTRDAFEVG